MSVAPFVVLVSISSLITALVLAEYGNIRRQHLLVTLSCFVAAAFSLFMIFILPLDVSSAFYRECMGRGLASTSSVNATSTASPPSNFTRSITITSFESTITTVTITTGAVSSTLNSSVNQTTPITSASYAPTTPIPPDCGYLMSEMPSSLLPTFWLVIYWSSQLLTWLILPLIQSYSTSGEFSIWRRILATIVENAIYYGSLGLLVLVFLLYLVFSGLFRFDIEYWKALLASAAITWGLFLCILFLGYGLVEIPRACWSRALYTSRLEHSFFQLAKLNVERAEAADKYNQVLEEIYALTQSIPHTHPLFHRIEEMMKRCPRDLHKYIRTGYSANAQQFGTQPEALTERILVRLNTRLINSQQLHSRTSVQFGELLQTCIELEVIISNGGSIVHEFRWPPGLAPELHRKRAISGSATSLVPTTPPVSTGSGSNGAGTRQGTQGTGTSNEGYSVYGSEFDRDSAILNDAVSISPDDTTQLIGSNDRGFTFYMRYLVAWLSSCMNVRDAIGMVWSNFTYRPKIEWYWYCMIRPQLLKVLAIFLILCSCIIVWSECTFFITSIPISALAALVELFASLRAYFSIELISFLALCYLSLCTYYTVFRIKIFNFYQLVPAHQTDETSLTFCATLLCRLTPSLCINFLGMVHRDTHIIHSEKDRNRTETYFTQVMGHMDVMAVIADAFNIYFPLLLLFLCAATYFRLGTRILNWLGFEQFMSSDDELTVDLVEDGRQLVRRECRKRERESETAARRQNLYSQGPAGGSSGSVALKVTALPDRERGAPIRGSGPGYGIGPDVGESRARPGAGPAARGRGRIEDEDSDDQPIDFDEQIASRNIFDFKFSRPK